MNAGGGVIRTDAVASFAIVYSAADALGNTATPVVRSVSVYDPCPPERYCPDTGVLTPRPICALGDAIPHAYPLCILACW